MGFEEVIISSYMKERDTMKMTLNFQNFRSFLLFLIIIISSIISIGSLHDRLRVLNTEKYKTIPLPSLTKNVSKYKKNLFI